jgi:hypothetical protein
VAITFDPKRAGRHHVSYRSSWFVVMTTDPTRKVTNWGEEGL